jgi:hypothetical protein
MTETHESLEADTGASRHRSSATDRADQELGTDPDPDPSTPAWETVVDNGQVFYDEDNPYDVELRFSLDGGRGVGVMALGPMDMAVLASQIEEVRIAQRKMQHLIDHGDLDEFVDDDAQPSPSVARNPGDSPGFDPAESDEHDQSVTAAQPRLRRKVEKATDPYGIRDALEKVPSIGKYSGKTVLTVAALVLLVLSGLLAIAL